MTLDWRGMKEEAMSEPTTDAADVAWSCPWTADYPDGCPYCANEMCATFDGLFGCRHGIVERHGPVESQP